MYSFINSEKHLVSQYVSNVVVGPRMQWITQMQFCIHGSKSLNGDVITQTIIKENGQEIDHGKQ